jgi:hypothetical protein
VEPVPEDDVAAVLAGRAAAARLAAEASGKLLRESREQLAETSRQLSAGRNARAVLHESVTARLVARLETMPVIEQAKGVLIAQTGCTADEAFDMLRAASQRSNVPVRDLAAGIVKRASSGHPERRGEGGEN